MSGVMYRRLILAAMVVAMAGPAHAYRTATAIDGDTLTVTSGGTTTGYRVRVVGIDAPEIRGKCPAERALAAQAKQRLGELTAGGITFLTDMDTDRYGRLLAQVFTRDGRDVADVLIAEGLARKYDGQGARKPWCPAP